MIWTHAADLLVTVVAHPLVHWWMAMIVLTFVVLYLDTRK
jgi:hypothetical protein